MSKTNFEILEDNKVRLTATVEAAEVDAAIKKVFKEASHKYKVPGFRPGKAPRAMLEGLLGDDYVKGLATDEVVNNTFGVLVDAEGYRVIGQPAFEDELLVTEGEPFTYTVVFEVRPELTLSTTDFEVTLPPREATEPEIEEQIDSTRERYASLEKVRARKIRDNDYVLLSFKSTLDGEDYEGSEVDHYMYQLGKGLMPAEFENVIIGAKPGEIVASEFVVEDLGDNAEFAGKTLHFDVELHEIHESKLPEVNDEFAVQVGFESLEKMREEVRSYITSSKENSYDRVKEQKLLEAVSATLEGEIPAALFEARKESIKRDFINMLRENEMSVDSYLRAANADFEQFDADLNAQAETALREELALEALARAKDLMPSAEEIEQEMVVIAGQLKTSVDAAKSRWAEMGLNSTLRDELARRKALDWLQENTNIVIDEMAFASN